MSQSSATTSRIIEGITAQMTESENRFRALGKPGSRVYNFASANRSNSGQFNEKDVMDTFAESLVESLRRSDESLERLSGGR